MDTHSLFSLALSRDIKSWWVLSHFLCFVRGVEAQFDLQDRWEVSFFDLAFISYLYGRARLQLSSQLVQF